MGLTERARARPDSGVAIIAGSQLRRCPPPSGNPATTTGWPRTALGLVSVLVLALAPMPGHAQEVVEIDDRITCPTCVIEAGVPVTLAPPTDHVWFRSVPTPGLARDSKGSYIMFPVEGDALIGVFGADGRYLSSYGSIGEGPGEFAPGFERLLTIGEGDVLYAIARPHLHMLAPRADSTLDQFRVPVDARDVTVLKNGTIAVQATVRTEAGITTIQILRPDGELEASIAPAATNVEEWDEWKALSQNRYMVRWDMGRVLGRSSDHKDVWSAHRNRYRISRYGRDGVEKIRIERIAKWFQPRFNRPPGAPPSHGFGGPIVAGIHEDADGLLWVAVLRAPSSISTALDEPAPAGVEVHVDPYMDVSQFLHTTVEVLDPMAGELVARHEFGEYAEFVDTPGDDVFMYSLRADAFGNIECTVRPLKLRRE